jgi:hypothetical protein
MSPEVRKSVIRDTVTGQIIQDKLPILQKEVAELLAR